MSDETIIHTPPPQKMYLHTPQPPQWRPDGWRGWDVHQRGQWLADRNMVMYRGHMVDANTWRRDETYVRQFVDRKLQGR
jgi:hypothetical protein